MEKPAEEVRRRDASEPDKNVPTSDGAVRELEKEAIAAQQRPRAGTGAAGVQAEPAVEPLGKYGGGVPEEDEARSGALPDGTSH